MTKEDFNNIWKKFILILVISLTLISCTKKGIDANVSESIDDYQVQYLFTVDDVKVYRFRDKCKLHYFVVGSNGTVDDYYVQSNGKSSTLIQDEILTYYKN